MDPNRVFRVIAHHKYKSGCNSYNSPLHTSYKSFPHRPPRKLSKRQPINPDFPHISTSESLIYILTCTSYTSLQAHGLFLNNESGSFSYNTNLDIKWIRWHIWCIFFHNHSSYKSQFFREPPIPYIVHFHLRSILYYNISKVLIKKLRS